MSPEARTVLLVEDDAATAELERRELVRAGIAVRLAPSVGDALVALRGQPFAAVLLDYALPDGDAWAVLDEAAAKRPAVPVIVVTGMGSEMVAAAAGNRGAAAYVKKHARYWEVLPGVIDRVTRLASAEERLRSTHALFHLVTDDAPDVIGEEDAERVIQYVSPSCRHVLGYAHALLEQALAAIRDVTALESEERKVRAALAERELLLKEIHHRVKNNLQVVSSLLHLQAAHVQGADAQQYFVESEARIRPIALAHEKLYQASDLASIELDDYLHDLVSAVAQTYGARRAAIDVTAPGIRLAIDTAVPVGMIVNELVSNSVKHAFPGDRRGTIVVSARSERGAIVLEVADDGMGLPPAVDPARPTSMGLQIVGSLTAQLGGELTVDRSGGGTRFEVRFDVNRGVASRSPSLRLTTHA